MIEEDKIRDIGKFQKTHALGGELNAIVDMDIDFFESNYPVIVSIDSIYVPFYVENVRPKGSTTILIKLQDIDSESEAKQFVNKKIYALKKDIQDYLEMEGMEYFEEDSLIGYEIIDDVTKTSLGIVEDIDDSTQNILFSVNTGDDLIYIPANDDLISNIDDEKNIIYMTVPEGIVDINRIHQDNDEI